MRALTLNVRVVIFVGLRDYAAGGSLSISRRVSCLRGLRNVLLKSLCKCRRWQEMARGRMRRHLVTCRWLFRKVS